jgi:hypothetical protein
MGGKSSGSSGEKAIAKVQSQLGQQEIKIANDYLEFSKKQYADNQGFVKQVLDVQLPAMREQLTAGREDRSRYLKYFAPLENNFATQAANYDTPARREAEAGKATADVASAAEAQRQNAAQTLESYGIDPSMTRAQAIDRQIGISTAATEAQAANTARQNVEDRGIALKQSAINIGRGFPGQSLSETQGAVGTGSTAIGSHMAPQQQLAQGYGVASNMFGGASNALAGASQTYSSINQMANQTPWLDTVGAIGGMALGAYAGRKAGAVKGGTGEEIAMRADPPAKSDTVPAMIDRHEFVVPKDVVMKKCTDFFHRLVDKTRESTGIPDGGAASAAPAPAAGGGGHGIVDWLRAHRSLPPSPEAPQGPPEVQQPPQGDATMRQLLGNVIGAGSIGIHRTGQSPLIGSLNANLIR